MMDTDIKHIIKKILFLPFEFAKGDNNQSIYSLLQNTGYFNAYSKIAESIILQELTNHSNCIEHWLSWSSNKRSTDGWYFIKKDNGKYVVGNINSDGQRSECFEFDSAAKACSVFIKREIESIRTS
ncbi:hypothetical protein RYH73_06255 [Olivibacter sp. CPCC 100613]|uniref:hypothetical protein n=1 Tax=Olivibacter sp. CPCC 100613 TaxID=3079931 RepID=UPI002FFB2FC2